MSFLNRWWRGYVDQESLSSPQAQELERQADAALDGAWHAAKERLENRAITLRSESGQWEDPSVLRDSTHTDESAVPTDTMTITPTTGSEESQMQGQSMGSERIRPRTSEANMDDPEGIIRPTPQMEQYLQQMAHESIQASQAEGMDRKPVEED